MIGFSMQDVVQHIDKILMAKMFKDTDVLYRPKPFKDIYLAVEKRANKAIHKVVMKDNGIPTLKKRGIEQDENRKVLMPHERLALLEQK